MFSIYQYTPGETINRPSAQPREATEGRTMALEDRIIGAESGGRANAKNPRSSATGAGQFIDSTWLAMIQKHRPDLAGLPRDQVLGMRNDPTLSREMTGAYAADNSAMLRSAGFDPTPGNQYLAHFAGPGGAKSVLGADPSTPVSQVLPPASIQANPFLKPMTAGDLMGWAAKKVGDTAPAMTMPGAPPAASGQFGVAGPQASPQAAAPMQMPAEQGTGSSFTAASVLQSLMRGAPSIGASDPGQAAPTPAPQPSRLSVDMLGLIGAGAPSFDAQRFYSLLSRKPL